MNKTQNKVFVSGLGAICGIGANIDSVFNSTLNSISAIIPVADDMAKWLPQMLYAPSSVEPSSLLDKASNGLDRATQFALVAGTQAMNAAGIIDIEYINRFPKYASRFGVYSGIGMGGAQTIDSMGGRLSKIYNAINTPDKKPTSKGPIIVHPLTIPRMMPNAPAAALSIRYGLQGPNATYCVACASSAVAIGEAYRAIKHGYIDAALVVGSEAMLNVSSLTAWQALRVTAKADINAPEKSCKPFDKNRAGFVLGEGAAALVLESQASINMRRAKNNCDIDILAEIIGYGFSNDATHITLPDKNGQIAAMQNAIDDSQITPEQIQYVNAHGTATEVGDVVECESVRGAFGDSAKDVAVSSTKAVHGHLIGAGGRWS